MNFLTRIYLIFLIHMRHTQSEVTLDVKRYKIVSEYNTARQFYPQIRNTKPFRNEPHLDSDSKKQICQDVISSHYIGNRLSYYLREKRSCFCPSADDYPAKLINVTTNHIYGGDGEVFQEWVFVCSVRRKFTGVQTKEFYISEEYKLGDESLAGRFVFRYFAKKVRLDGLAEPTAVIQRNANRDVEHIYLERRENHIDPAPDSSTDALCSLDWVTKIRICTTVFGSEHFETLPYPPSQVNWIDGSCEKRSLQFRTREGKEKATRRNYAEWMMNCKPTDEIQEDFDYFLSHAYQSNEIFVYFWDTDDEMYLVNIATNIRITYA